MDEERVKMKNRRLGGDETKQFSIGLWNIQGQVGTPGKIEGGR